MFISQIFGIIPSLVITVWLGTGLNSVKIIDNQGERKNINTKKVIRNIQKIKEMNYHKRQAFHFVKAVVSCVNFHEHNILLTLYEFCNFQHLYLKKKHHRQLMNRNTNLCKKKFNLKGVERTWDK